MTNKARYYEIIRDSRESLKSLIDGSEFNDLHIFVGGELQGILYIKDAKPWFSHLNRRVNCEVYRLEKLVINIDHRSSISLNVYRLETMEQEAAELIAVELLAKRIRPEHIAFAEPKPHTRRQTFIHY